MPLVVLEHATTTSKHMQTHTLVCTATGIASIFLFYEYLMYKTEWFI
jgi:hypothetical protein